MRRAAQIDPGGWLTALGAGILVGALVLLVGGLLLFRARAAGRAREARARIEAARASLDAALMRRTMAAREFASIGCLDPSSAIIVLRCVGDVLDACDQAQDETDLLSPERLEAEEHLTEALRRSFKERSNAMAQGCTTAALGPQAQAAKRALALASERVHAQRLRHNEVVHSTRHLVTGRSVRLLGVGRGTARPEVLQVEDDIPHLRPGGGAADVD